MRKEKNKIKPLSQHIVWKHIQRSSQAWWDVLKVYPVLRTSGSTERKDSKIMNKAGNNILWQISTLARETMQHWDHSDQENCENNNNALSKVSQKNRLHIVRSTRATTTG